DGEVWKRRYESLAAKEEVSEEQVSKQLVKSVITQWQHESDAALGPLDPDLEQEILEELAMEQRGYPPSPYQEPDDDPMDTYALEDSHACFVCQRANLAYIPAENSIGCETCGMRVPVVGEHVSVGELVNHVLMLGRNHG
ncbi:hypothetical protein HK097_005947, partial [Rhizophlyctis rosea]